MTDSRRAEWGLMACQPPAAFLSIKTQFDNIGDALINRELCRLVASRADTWVDFSRAPENFERAMGVSSLPNLTTLRRWGFARLLREIIRQRLSGRACYLFLNPGGLGGSRLSLKGRLSATTYNILLSAMRIAGVRICHAGISFDPMRAPELLIARWRRRLLHSFTVRDSLSLRYVDSVGMPADSIVPDLSFNLYSAPVPSANAPRRHIAFSFRFDGKSTNDAIKHAVRRVIETNGADCEYLFVAQVSRDMSGMKRLSAIATEAGAAARVISCVDDIDGLCDVYSTCRAIFSNRLHALLMAAHAGAIPFALISRGQQPKIEGMFEDLGLGQWLIDVDAVADWQMPEEFDRNVLEAQCVALQSHFDTLLQSPRCVSADSRSEKLSP